MTVGAPVIEDIAWMPDIPKGHTKFSWEVEEDYSDDEGASAAPCAKAPVSPSKTPATVAGGGGGGGSLKIVDGVLKWTGDELAKLPEAERERAVVQIEAAIRMKSHKISQGIHNVYVRHCVNTGRPTAKVISGKSQVLEAVKLLHGVGDCCDAAQDEQNKKDAAAFLLETEIAEIPEALSLLGYCFQFGEGVKEDPKRALSLYEKAAKLGDPHGMVRLGRAQHAQGLDKTTAKALIDKGCALLQAAVDSGKLTLEEQSRALSLLHTNHPLLDKNKH